MRKRRARILLVLSNLLCIAIAGGLVAGEATGARAKQSAPQEDRGTKAMNKHEVSAREMRDEWVLDGEAELTAVGERELKISATGKMALWCPTMYEGRVAVEFDCMVSEPRTKLLLLVHGHGSDGTPVREWKRDGSYDHYNAGRMEVYTIAINRGLHISRRPGDQLANVRRIGGPAFAVYTGANFRKHAREGRGFWNQWNTLSLLGAALEPARGTGKYLRHRIVVDPPHVRLEVEGTEFADIVDHRPNPLTRGCVGFRCMSKGRTFFVRNVVIEGHAATSKQESRKSAVPASSSLGEAP